LDPAIWRTVFGDRPVAGSDDDLFTLLDRADPAELPALWLACGTEDHLHADTVRFAAAAEARGVPVEVDLSPGAHDWAYWDEAVQRVLAWLPLST
ncbi:esterase family protein, partial [Micromonospora zhanjiangensis]